MDEILKKRNKYSPNCKKRLTTNFKPLNFRAQGDILSQTALHRRLGIASRGLLDTPKHNTHNKKPQVKTKFCKAAQVENSNSNFKSRHVTGIKTQEYLFVQKQKTNLNLVSVL